ncbi:MAG TPA: type II toxin-antitoxin system HicA family toxin, partial [Solirubrobacterales bacterium]
MAVLERKPLNYGGVRQAGSHRRMRSPVYPSLTFAFHDSATITPAGVRKVLVDEVGLADNKARE